ncbi:hypothetical protein B296_00046444 [Ensete ventricosum]|uniref:Uncharacterized protein n=1 Tax=Ensete ventricosum TaxID=4639 RepID=A0A426Y3T9_ENSVE|nr:hypothetical protein B296_00046444 [Ensete ventricosum]
MLMWGFATKEGGGEGWEDTSCGEGKEVLSGFREVCHDGGRGESYQGRARWRKKPPSSFTDGDEDATSVIRLERKDVAVIMTHACIGWGC